MKFPVCKLFRAIRANIIFYWQQSRKQLLHNLHDIVNSLGIVIFAQLTLRKKPAMHNMAPIQKIDLPIWRCSLVVNVLFAKNFHPPLLSILLAPHRAICAQTCRDLWREVLKIAKNFGLPLPIFSMNFTQSSPWLASTSPFRNLIKSYRKVCINN